MTTEIMPAREEIEEYLNHVVDRFDLRTRMRTAGSIVERLRAAVESTGAEGFGAFAGLYPLDERRFLVAT